MDVVVGAHVIVVLFILDHVGDGSDQRVAATT